MQGITSVRWWGAQCPRFRATMASQLPSSPPEGKARPGHSLEMYNFLSQFPFKSPGGGNHPNGPQVKKVGQKTDLVEKGTSHGIRGKKENI